jgi:hypothetical protein
MFERLPILSSLGGMLNRRDPRKVAEIALARILSQFDMSAIPYETGVRPSRRDGKPRSVTIGIWLVPIAEASAGKVALGQSTILGRAIPAATCDLRRQGFGVLVPVQLTSERFLVAVGDMENTWRFFVTRVQHQSPRPGGWVQIGLKLETLFEPDTQQMLHFRTRITTAFADSEIADVAEPDPNSSANAEADADLVLPLAK